MATFKFGDISTLILDERITTPSIHLQKDSNHWYVPLFEGDKDSVVQDGDYNYTLGGLKVGNLRVAIGREEVMVSVVVSKIFTASGEAWVLTQDGDLYGCGGSGWGQHGNGVTGSAESTLVFTKRASNVKAVSCSTQTTWYIDFDNNLYGCGSNENGQQGNGSSGKGANVSTFTKRAENVKEVRCTNTSTWYLTQDGDLYGCGYNYYGQQSSGGRDDVSTFTKRAENVKAFRISGNTTWYIDNNDDLYGCGYNYNGNQGSGLAGTNARVLTLTKRASNVKEVFCTNNITRYIDNDNNLYSCGSGYRGQHGNGSKDELSYSFRKRAENVKQISCSDVTTWYIDNNHDLYGCGYNKYGQQGDGSSGDEAEVLTFTKRAENVKEVRCSDDTTWYIDFDNNLYGCGWGNLGRQGNGSTENVLTFTKKAENVKEVICGVDLNDHTTWYIDFDNNLYGCGYNASGQQGTGNYDNVLTFTKKVIYKNI